MVFTSLIAAGVVALVITLALLVAIPSRYVRARLQFSVWLLAAFVTLQIAVLQDVGDVAILAALARLVFVLAVLNLGITLLANPWREDRPSDRFPAIVQDVTLIGLFTIIATVLMKEQLLTTSAVGAVVVGFALQDTLGNLFSGLAIQIEKPFRVGHWIAVGEREGQVQEITWRATKLRTKAGQFLIVPNGIISKEAILNYSEPTVPTRLQIDVGTSYLTAAERGESGGRGSARQLPAGAGDAAAGHVAPRLRRIGADLSRVVLGRRLRARARSPRSGPHEHLVHLPAQEHRDSVADSNRVFARGAAAAFRRRCAVGGRAFGRDRLVFDAAG